jgi:UDP-N-acetylmuramoyl-tripeptide--D-alanyl-D-alanine ligase
VEVFHLKELIHAIKADFVTGDINVLINGVSINSKTIKKGEVYFAIHGKRYNGHNFIDEAISRGARAVVYSNNIDLIKNKSIAKTFPLIRTDNTVCAIGKLAKVYREKFTKTKIICISGSNGKTTTKEILASILSIKGKIVYSKHSFNNKIGLPLSIFDLTTNVKYAVFEIGTSSCGEISTLSDIAKPDFGVITNIGLSHLEYFWSLNNVFNEKIELFKNVKKDGYIIINNDDNLLKTIPKLKASGYKIVTFALKAHADVYARNILFYQDRTIFKLFFKKESISITIPMNGIFNVSNALAAASCAIVLGFSLNDIKIGIENFKPPKMRMETVITHDGIILINDAYNANPSSVKKSIEAVAELYIDKKINIIIGDMLELGDKSKKYHYELGQFINNQKINSVNLLGEMSFNTKKSINKNVFFSKNKSDILKNLMQLNVDNNSVFLFKASRKLKLEDIFFKFYNFLEKRK